MNCVICGASDTCSRSNFVGILFPGKLVVSLEHMCMLHKCPMYLYAVWREHNIERLSSSVHA